MSVRGFAGYLGVSARTVSSWEAGGAGFAPGPESQALLDTALDRADHESKARFQQCVDVSDALAIKLIPPLEPGLIDRQDLDHLLGIMRETAASADGAPLIAVAGPGGFGKTTLAKQACHDPATTAAFPQVCWIETGEGCTPARIVELISDLCVHLDGSRPGLVDPEQAGFHLARVIGDRRMLLVIDNVWSAADLAPFLLGAPRCLRLVTTRNIRVSPAAARVLRLGPMSHHDITELLHRNVPGLARDELAQLAMLCGGWPLLANIVGANVGFDLAAGAPVQRCVQSVQQALLIGGPQAFDVADADQRSHAIGHAMAASLRSLDDNVTITGATNLRERYLSLAIFPAAVPIPIPLLVDWWGHAHGWTEVAVRQFCRIATDRCLVSAYLADRDVIMLHDIFRDYLRHLTSEQLPGWHQSLLTSIPEDCDHDYLWRYRSSHMRDAALIDELIVMLANLDYVCDKALRCGHQALTVDHEVLRSLPNTSAPLYQIAAALTGYGYLLHGLTRREDMQLSLTIVLARHRLGLPAVTQGAFVGVPWASRANDSGQHVGAVVSIAHGHGTLASGGEDGVLRLWDLHDARLQHACRGHTGWIYATAIAPDGTVAASAGDDTIIRLWNVATGGPLAALNGHTSRVRALSFTSDGHSLVSGGEDGRICVWDLQKRALSARAATPGVPIWTIAVGLNDEVIAAAGQDEYLRLYHRHTGELLAEHAAHRDWIRTIAFGEDDSTLLAASGDMTMSAWSASPTSLSPLWTVPTGSRVRSIVVTETGQISCGGEDGTVRVYEAQQLTAQTSAPAGVDWVRSLCRSPGGRIVAGCEDGAIRSLQGTQLTTFAAGANTVWAAALTLQGQTAVLGHGDGTINLCDTKTMTRYGQLDAGPGRVWALATGGQRIAAACGDGNVRVWSTTDLQEIWSLNSDHRRSWAVALSHDGNLLTASDATGQVRLWDLSSGQLRWVRDAHAGRVRSLAFDGSDNTIAAGGGDAVVRVWNTANGANIGDFEHLSGWARTVALDPTGQRLAVGTGAGNIEIREVGTGKLLAELHGHAGRVLAVTFTHDDDQLVSTAADGTTRIWSLADSQHIAQVRVDASAQCATFDPASGHLLIGSAQGLARLTIRTR